MSKDENIIDQDNTEDVQEETAEEIVPEEEIVAEENLKDKVKELRLKLKEADTEKKKYLDSWQRAQADFLNLRKRDEEAKKEFMKFATEDLISEILPVIDSFTMAFSNKESWEKVDKNWRSGVEYIYNQLLGILKDRGLKEFDPKGEIFDPKKHEAISSVDVKDEKDDHKVIEVISKGYMMSDKIVRPAKVKVGEFKK